MDELLKNYERHKRIETLENFEEYIEFIYKLLENVSNVYYAVLLMLKTIEILETVRSFCQFFPELNDNKVIYGNLRRTLTSKFFNDRNFFVAYFNGEYSMRNYHIMNIYLEYSPDIKKIVDRCKLRFDKISRYPMEHPIMESRSIASETKKEIVEELLRLGRFFFNVDFNGPGVSSVLNVDLRNRGGFHPNNSYGNGLEIIVSCKTYEAINTGR